MGKYPFAESHGLWILPQQRGIMQEKASVRHGGDTAEELVTRHLSHSLEDVADIMERYPDYFVRPRGRA